MSTLERWQDEYAIRVVDLKQYVYCPRVAYYQIALPGVRPVTYKMERGLAEQRREEARERRRRLRAYGLSAGRRFFNVPLSSAELGLTGELDMLVETDEELIPVDYKYSKRLGPHFNLQLMAYGRLLEVAGHETRKVVRRGFLYLIPERKAVEVPFSQRLRSQLAQALADLRAIAMVNRFPRPTAHKRKCVDCEFRHFCNDVL